MTTEKPTNATEEFVVIHGEHKLAGFLAIPSIPSGNTVPAVIAAHGFAGSASQRKFVEMGRIFAENGIAFLRFDFSGCGNSRGDSADMSIDKWTSDFSRAYDFLRQRKEIDTHRIGFLGYSLGAVIACLYMEKSGKAVSADVLVLVAPALDQERLMKLWHTPAEIKKWRKQGYLDTLKGRIGAKYLAGAKDYNYLAEKITTPTLVVHGGKDKDVPARFVERTFNKLRGDQKKLVVVEEADHGFEGFYAKKELIDVSLAWFQKYLVQKYS